MPWRRKLVCMKQTVHMMSLPCADISNYSRKDKDMLRGAGLMSQASGLGQAPARTTIDAPSKVRLCCQRILQCPLRSYAFMVEQARALSLTQAPGPVSAKHPVLKMVRWQQCGLRSMTCCYTSQAPMTGFIKGDWQGRSYGYL